MINIVRFRKSDKAIVGRVTFQGIDICYSLENAEKAIPCGVYRVENSKSPKFKRELPLIYGDKVPASRGIRMHSGNDAVKDSAGCVLVGMGAEGWTLTESANAEIMLTMLCRGGQELIVSEDY